MAPSLLTAALIFAGVFVFVLACREIAAWYFKINSALTLLQSIDARLAGLAEQLGEALVLASRGPEGAQVPASSQVQTSMKMEATSPDGERPNCSKCSAPLRPPGRFCAQCGTAQGNTTLR